MMMARESSGRSAMAGRRLLALLGLLAAAGGHAAEAPEAPEAPVPPPLVSPEAEAPHQVVVESEQRVRWLDPAVFTDISPLTQPDIGIRLPPDQQE